MLKRLYKSNEAMRNYNLLNTVPGLYGSPTCILFNEGLSTLFAQLGISIETEPGRSWAVLIQGRNTYSVKIIGDGCSFFLDFREMIHLVTAFNTEEELSIEGILLGGNECVINSKPSLRHTRLGIVLCRELTEHLKMFGIDNETRETSLILKTTKGNYKVPLLTDNIRTYVAFDEIQEVKKYRILLDDLEEEHVSAINEYLRPFGIQVLAREV